LLCHDDSTINITVDVVAADALAAAAVVGVLLLLLYTTLFAIKGSNNKKTNKTKKKKQNKLLQDKSNTTGQHNSILGLIFSAQSTNDIIGYGELAQKLDFLLLMHTEGSEKLNISMQLVATSLDLVLNIFMNAPTTTYSKDLKSADERNSTTAK